MVIVKVLDVFFLFFNNVKKLHISQDGHHKWKMAKPKIAPAFSVLRFDFACLELTGQMCEVEALL